MKSLSIKYLLSIVAGIALINTGCGFVTSSIEIKNQAVPITIDKKNCPTISVANIISDIQPETRIGTYHTGCLNVPGSDYSADALSGFEEKIEKEIETELIDANYPIVENKEQLFEEKQLNTQLLVGGVIFECKFNSYDSMCGVYSESTVSVKWQLMDKSKNKIVYEKSTVGSAEYPGVNMYAVAYAVRGSFKEVLADPLFVEALMK
jgi:hypothetical protein